MPPLLPQLDHTVINVRYAMDSAARCFDDLGFYLTERGYHSLGSINHLMMFELDYLELIGLPAEAEHRPSGRPDIQNAAVGINGLVFKTANADETFSHLQAIGMAADPPKSFSRPVDLPTGRQDARFRTVHVRGDVFPGGRVYFCEHHTPELVWRPEWQTHRNGALKTREFVIASEEFEREAEAMGRLLRVPVSGNDAARAVAIDRCVVSFVSPGAYQARYGALASEQAGRSSLFGAIVIEVGQLAAVRAMVAGWPVPVIVEADRIVVRQPEFDCVLEFVGRQ